MGNTSHYRQNRFWWCHLWIF